ncbi:histidinol-phosphatase [Lentisphaerota bacterium WC36G]|nr:histidinol-phosphatase [Lentisphaerae bacterium WC36]
MIIADLHSHTKLCKHATGMPIDYVKAAIKKGELDILGVSDHFPFSAGFDLESRMFEDEWNCYRDAVCEAQKYGKKHNFEVLFGTEIDYVEDKFSVVLDALESVGQDLDYVIGSVHCANNIAFDNPAFLNEWESDEFCDKVYESYALNLIELIKSNSFNIIGHVDLPKKFGFYPSTPRRQKLFHEALDYAFELAVEYGIAFEMNSAGKYKTVKEFYPNKDILKLAAQRNMLVTFGSDAHSPDAVGSDFAEMRELAKHAGLTQSVFFRKKQPFIEKII